MPSCAYWWQGAVRLYIRQGRWGQRFSKNQFGWRDRRRFPFMRRILLSAFVVRLLPFRAERKKRDLVSEELSENAFCAVAARSQNMPFTYRGAQEQRNCVELNLKEQTIKNYTHKIYKNSERRGAFLPAFFSMLFFKKRKHFSCCAFAVSLFYHSLLSLPPFEKSNFCLLCRKWCIELSKTREELLKQEFLAADLKIR